MFCTDVFKLIDVMLRHVMYFVGKLDNQKLLTLKHKGST